jgi:hypothetical protein
MPKNPNSQLIRESHALLPADWTHLDQIATDLDAVNASGRLAGHPSWRALLRKIAQGQLVVITKSDAALLATIKELVR